MPTILEAIEPLMNGTLGPASARAVFRTLPASAHKSTGTLNVIEVRDLMTQLVTSGRLFARPGQSIQVNTLRTAVTGGTPAKPVEERYPIVSDRDVLTAQRASQNMTRGIFGTTDSVRLATAVSELGRNIYMYAQKGEVTLRLTEEPTAFLFELVASDQGPGIPNLDIIMRGDYRSRTGLGRGIAGTKALLNTMTVDTAKGKGTRIEGALRVRKT